MPIYQDKDGGIRCTIISTLAADTPGAVSYDCQIWRSETESGTYTKWKTLKVSPDDDPDTPTLCEVTVETGVWYKFRWRGRNFAGWPGNWSPLTVAARHQGKNDGPAAPSGFVRHNLPLYSVLMWDPCLAADYAQTEVYAKDPSESTWNLVGATQGTSFIDYRGLTVGFFPNTSNYRIRHVNRSGVPSAYSVTLTTEPTTLDSVQYFADGIINNRQLAHGAGFEIATAYTASAFGTFGTSQQEIQSATLPHGSGASLVEIYTEFTNVSGGTRDFLISIYADGTLIRGRTQSLADKEQASVTFHDLAPGGSSTTYSVAVQSDSATNNVQQRYLRVVSRW